MSSWLLGGYLAGALVALAATDDRWPVRLALAVCWPLGPLAFLVVIAGLAVVAAILWPWLGVALLGLGALVAWYLS